MNIGLQPQQYSSLQGYYTNNNQKSSALVGKLIKNVEIPTQTLVNKNQKDFKLGAISIQPEANAIAGKLYEAKIANAFSKEWMAVVELAMKANGGMGNAEQGFLAWSKDGNFVRLNNPRLSAEQNQKLAEISLKSGIAIEDLPSRWETQSTSDPKVNDKLNNFITDFETKFQAMQNGQSTSLKLNDKKHIYSMELDKNSGYVISDHQKEKNWFQKFVGKKLKFIGPVLDVVSKYAGFIPGYGTLIAAAASAAKWAMQSISTGKVKFQGLISAAATAVSGYLGTASSWLSSSTIGQAIGSAAKGNWGEVLKSVGGAVWEWGKEKLGNYVQSWLSKPEQKPNNSNNSSIMA